MDAQLSEHPALVAYVERISREVFSVPLPTAPPITSTAWAQRAEDSSTSPQAERCLPFSLFIAWQRCCYRRNHAYFLDHLSASLPRCICSSFYAFSMAKLQTHWDQ